MATFTAINCKRQSGGAMKGTLDYVSQKKKTLWGDAQLVVGHNCVPQSAYTEMLTTKQQFRKTNRRQFYHFVQSFAEDDPITPAEANAIGLELAQWEFPGFEVVIATHVDTNHIHNHLVVNSVSCVDGKKLHQSADDLLAHRQANDEICLAHGLNTLEQPEKQSRMKRMKPSEYQAGLYADSWKLDLVQTINDVLEYAGNPDEFVEGMEREGYQVTWTENRKHITFTCPNGRRCRDSRLHDETFLKENMEALFVYRQMVDFHGEYSEPAIGWIGEVSQSLLQLGRQLERDADQPPLPAPPVWTDSKLRRREALKKLAQGQKLSHDSHSQSQGMMGY